jgi:hypothetical protein
MTKTITGAIKSAAVAVKAAVTREPIALAMPDEPLTHATGPDGFVRFGGTRLADMMERTGVGVPIRLTSAAFSAAIEQAPGDLETRVAVLLNAIARAARQAEGNIAIARIQHDRTARGSLDGAVHALGATYTTDLVCCFSRHQRTGVTIEVTIATIGEAPSAEWHANVPPSESELAAEREKEAREDAAYRARVAEEARQDAVNRACREINGDIAASSIAKVLLEIQQACGLRDKDGVRVVTTK